MANLTLTMALSHYDRHVPLFDGSVTAENVDLRVLEVGQSDSLKHGKAPPSTTAFFEEILRLAPLCLFCAQVSSNSEYGKDVNYDLLVIRNFNIDGGLVRLQQGQARERRQTLYGDICFQRFSFSDQLGCCVREFRDYHDFNLFGR